MPVTSPVPRHPQSAGRTRCLGRRGRGFLFAVAAVGSLAPWALAQSEVRIRAVHISDAAPASLPPPARAGAPLSASIAPDDSIVLTSRVLDALPLGDACETAPTVGYGRYVFSFTGATDGSGTCAAQTDRWLRFVSPIEGGVRVLACRPGGLVSPLALHLGPCVQTSLPPEACGVGACGLAGVLLNGLAAGQQVLIRISGGTDLVGPVYISVLPAAGSTPESASESGDQALWLSPRSAWTAGAEATLLRREGDAVAFDATVSHASLESPAVNRAGQVLFTGALDGPLPAELTHAAIVSREPNGSWSARARETLPATTTTPVLPLAPPLDDAGRTAYANVDGSALVHGDSSILVGSQAPGLAAGVTFGPLEQPALARSGAAVFWARLAGVGVGESGAVTLWHAFAPGDTPRLIARTGSTLPAGTGGLFVPPAWTLRALGLSPGINSGGRTVYWAAFSGVGADATSDEALIVDPGSPGSPPIVIAREGVGVDLPGAPSVRMGPLPGRPAIGDDGRVVFVAVLVGPDAAPGNNSAVLTIFASGEMSIIAREGDQAPGLPAGAHFSSFGAPAIGDAGHVAFLAGVRGPSPADESFALMLAAPGAAPRVVAQTGGEVTLPGGRPPRTIRDLTFRGGHAHAGRAVISPSGTAVFAAAFTDGSSALLTAQSICAADFNGVGGITPQDIYDFLAAWLAGDPAADFNSVGGVTPQDLFEFLGAWSAGCV